MDGFKITEGFADNDTVPGGAGIYCNGASPLIRNCIITNNFAKNGLKGGGIYITGNSNPRLINCLIAGNFAETQNCGGIYQDGGTLELINCDVVDNAGDGIHCVAANLNINNSIIWHNRMQTDNLTEFPVREIVLTKVLTKEAVATFNYSNVEQGTSGIINNDDCLLHWDDDFGSNNIGNNISSNNPQFSQWGTWKWKLAKGTDIVQNTSLQSKEDELTIYDFLVGVADMGKGKPGIVENEFTGDWLYQNYNPQLPFYNTNPSYNKTPVFESNPQERKDTISKDDNFYLWFTTNNIDGKGPRRTQQVPWVCTNPDKGVFTFNSEHFFPIDNWCTTGYEDFCQEKEKINCYDSITWHSGQSVQHNYFFSLQYHGKYTYIPNQKLFFKASDDLIVAINGRVVVDRCGYFNLDNQGKGGSSRTTVWLKDGKAYVYENPPINNPYDVENLPNPLVIGDFNRDSAITELLEPFKNYDFDLFFAQRSDPLSVLVAERTPGDNEIVESFNLGDYQLNAESPCIDAGDNYALPEDIVTDLQGAERRVDDLDTEDNGNGEPPIVDMGAYEFMGKNFNLRPEANPDEYGILHNTVLTINDSTQGVLRNDSDPDGDGLEAVLVTGVQCGTLNLNADGTFTYTPSANFHGMDGFVYKAVDSRGLASEPVEAAIEVVNNQPISQSDTYILDGTHLSVDAANGVLANDSDPEGDALTAYLIREPTYGNLNFHPDGSFEYTLTTGYTTIDRFTYRAKDSQGLYSAITTVTIRVVSQPPLAVAYNYTCPKNKSIVKEKESGVLSNYFNQGITTMSAFPDTVDDISKGVLNLNQDGSFNFNPSIGFIGEFNFSYKIHDIYGNWSAPANVTIYVTNTAPLAIDDSYFVSENEILQVTAPTGNDDKRVLANDTDENGDLLTAQLVTGVSHGSLTLSSDGSFTYTPNKGFYGTDSFTCKAIDSDSNPAQSQPATVTITVGQFAVYAGKDRTISLSKTSVEIDDADYQINPAVSGEKIKWSVVESSMEGLSIQNNTQKHPTVTFNLAADTFNLMSEAKFVLRLTVTSGVTSVSDDVVITVVRAASDNQPPVVDAGQYPEISAGQTLNLAGKVTDDGKPFGTLFTGWEPLENMPKDFIIIGDKNNVDTTVKFTQDGNYVLKLWANDGAVKSESLAFITVNPPNNNHKPTAYAGADRVVDIDYGQNPPSIIVTLNDAQAHDPDGDNTIVSVEWVGKSVSGNGDFMFLTTPPNDPRQVKIKKPGIYVLTMQVSDAEFTVSDEVVITVNGRPFVDAGSNQQATLNNGYTTVTMNAKVVDNVYPYGQELYGNCQLEWTVIDSPTGSVVDFNPDTLGENEQSSSNINPTIKFTTAGKYILQLTATDPDFSGSVSDSVNIYIYEAQLI